MSASLGKGDYQVPDPDPDAEEATFRAREHFVDVLQEVADDAYRQFREIVDPSVRDVFRLHGDQVALMALLVEADRPSDWPPPEWSPYSSAFFGWPTAILPFLQIPLDGAPFLQGPPDCAAFHAWILTTLLQDPLDFWSETSNLRDAPWVASHLLVRACREYLASEAGEERPKGTNPQRVFPSLGVPVPFQEALAESFKSFPSWDPTQERWKAWRDEATRRFSETLAQYQACVNDRSSERHAGSQEALLSPTPHKRKADRDFRRLVRFQILGETLAQLPKPHEELSAVQKAVVRTARLIKLKLRTLA